MPESFFNKVAGLRRRTEHLRTTSYQKIIESLDIEIYKFQAGLIPPTMSDLFVTTENNYNLRNFQALESSHKRTVEFGTETISYRGPKIWNLINDIVTYAFQSESTLDSSPVAVT